MRVYFDSSYKSTTRRQSLCSNLVSNHMGRTHWLNYKKKKWGNVPSPSLSSPPSPVAKQPRENQLESLGSAVSSPSRVGRKRILVYFEHHFCLFILARNGAKWWAVGNNSCIDRKCRSGVPASKCKVQACSESTEALGIPE